MRCLARLAFGAFGAVCAVCAFCALGCAEARREGARMPVAGSPIVDGGAAPPLTVEALPGETPPMQWPPPLIFSRGRYLLPWHDGDGLHARVLRAGAAPSDILLGSGRLAGAAPWRDGFALSSLRGQVVTIYFLDGAGNVVSSTVDAVGLPAPALAGDGEHALVAATVPSNLPPHPATGAAPPPLDAHALVIAPGEPPAFVELGLVQATPPVYGDASGFIVDGTYQLSAGRAGLAVSRAPAEALAGARLFRQLAPLGDLVSTDGDAWAETGGDVAWAVTDGAGVAVDVTVDGVDELLALDGELHLIARAPVPPSGGLRGARGDRALYEEILDGGDHAFTVLDRAGLATRPGAGWVRVPAPSSRTVAVVLGDSDLLLAWIDADRVARYALWPR